MKRQLFPKAVIPMLTLLMAFFSCKTVTRENIISSVNTGIGVMIAENPKTELYEVKVGYIRSQYYSVPTGKTVENEKNGDPSNTDMRANDADITPQLVSGIRMDSGIEHFLVGVDVSENFAVGNIAVMSPAAVAMYMSKIENEKIASSTSQAVEAMTSLAEDKIRKEKNKADKIISYVFSDGELDPNKLKSLAKDTAWEGSVNSIDHSIDQEQLRKLLNNQLSFAVDELYIKLPNEYQ